MTSEQTNKLRLNEMRQEVYNIVISNGQFYRSNPQDDSRYSIGQGVLDLLSLIAINLALPILVGMATNWIYDKVKKSLDRGEDYINNISPNDAEQEIMHILLTTTIKKIEDNRKQEAVQIVKELLLFHGCPKRKVEKISIDIVKEIVLVIEGNNTN